MTAIPLTPALSPMGRGRLAEPALSSRLPELVQSLVHASFPLPMGERVRVRGHMRQDDIQTHHARILRQSRTSAEALLWNALRARKFCGLKFRRQVPIGRHVVGFYCAELRLIVEAEGGRMDELHRDRWLCENGFHLVRLSASEVETNLAAALTLLKKEVER